MSAIARTLRPASEMLAGGLAFDRRGGPLVAVCGLAGGAGTSTLALALGRQAACESAAPALLCEVDSRAGGLAVTARVRSPYSLGQLAAAAFAGQALDRPAFALAPGGLRVIAAGAGSALGDPGQLGAVLEEARAAHGLVVVDAGVLGSAAAQAALEAATHALLVMPATAVGLARAEQLLASGLAPRHAATLVAVAAAERSVKPRELRRLAERHVDRLIFVPHIAAFRRGEGEAGPLALTLTAIATALRTG